MARHGAPRDGSHATGNNLAATLRGKRGLYLRMGLVAVVLTLYYLAVVGALTWAVYMFGDYPPLHALGGVVTVLVVYLAYRYWRDVRSGLQGNADVSALTAQHAPTLHRALDTYSDSLDIAKPTLYEVEDSALNAYALGRRGSGAIYITTGLRDALSTRELRAILAHELAHLYHRDSLLLQAVISLQLTFRRAAAWPVHAVLFLCRLALAVLVSPLTRRRRRFRLLVGRRRAYWRRPRWSARLTHLITGLAGSLVALAVLLPGRALSRYREYVADATAVGLLGQPRPLTAALQQLDAQPDTSDSGAHSPPHLLSITAVSSGIASWFVFATHPSIDKRIARLREQFGRQ